MHANGRGVKQDYKQAMRWYQQAADQGHASAQCKLGDMYAKGQGVKQDSRQAVRWYREAADQGNAVAREKLVSKQDE